VSTLEAQPGKTTWTFPTAGTLTTATCSELKAIFPGGPSHIYSVPFNANGQAATLKDLADAIAAGEDSISAATVNINVVADGGSPAVVADTGIIFTGLANGTTMARGSFSISAGGISTAATPIDVIETIATAKNPPETDNGIARVTEPASAIASSTNAIATVQFLNEAIDIKAGDKLTVIVGRTSDGNGGWTGGTSFETAALSAGATAADISAAFEDIVDADWTIVDHGNGLVSFEKVAPVTSAYLAGSTVTSVTNSGTAGTVSSLENEIAISTAVDPIVGENTVNFSGLDLIKGDLVTITVTESGGAGTFEISGSFDTDLKTTVANLAADLKLEENTFSNVTVDNYIITYNGLSDGTATRKTLTNKHSPKLYVQKNQNIEHNIIQNQSNPYLRRLTNRQIHEKKNKTKSMIENTKPDNVR
jgi:hypothetical protein